MTQPSYNYIQIVQYGPYSTKLSCFKPSSAIANLTLPSVRFFETVHSHTIYQCLSVSYRWQVNKRVLTVHQRLLNPFPIGHYERAILEDRLVKRLSSDLKKTFQIDKYQTGVILTSTNSVLSSAAVIFTPVSPSFAENTRVWKGPCGIVSEPTVRDPFHARLYRIVNGEYQRVEHILTVKE